MEGREALSATAPPRLRFRALGGLPPPSHEDLLVAGDGAAWYVTGMPWPRQRPFDEIGAYRMTVDAPASEALADAAREVLAEAPMPTGSADVGIEGVGLDGAEAYWSQETRPAAAPALIDRARALITAARERPWAVVHGRVSDATRVQLTNRGDHPLSVRDGELRAGWGLRDDPPTPLELAPRPLAPVALPAELAPRATLTLTLPEPGPRPPSDADAVHALVHLRFRSPIDDDWIDGWLVAGPGTSLDEDAKRL
jgi:hypothetical protein